MRIAVFLMLVLFMQNVYSQKKILAAVFHFKDGNLIEKKDFSYDGLILHRTFYLRYLNEERKIEETYTYEKKKLASLEIWSASDSSLRWQYEYDTNGVLIFAYLFRAGQEISSERYKYGLDGRLIQEVIRQANDIQMIDYRYNNSEKILEKTITKDSASGRVLEKETSFFTDFDSLAETRTYHADGTIEVVRYIYDVQKRLVEKQTQLNGAFLSKIRYTYVPKNILPVREYHLNSEDLIVMEKKFRYKKNKLPVEIITTDYRIWGFEEEKNKRTRETFKYEYYR